MVERVNSNLQVLQQERTEGVPLDIENKNLNSPIGLNVLQTSCGQFCPVPYFNLDNEVTMSSIGEHCQDLVHDKTLENVSRV